MRREFLIKYFIYEPKVIHKFSTKTEYLNLLNRIETTEKIVTKYHGGR